MKKEAQLRIAVVISACWIILMPPIWARTLSSRFGFEYFEFLAFYVPELVVAAACLILLPGAWVRKGWAVAGVVLAAILLPILKYLIGSPSSGTWFVSSALMLLVAAGTWSQRSSMPLTLTINADGKHVRAFGAHMFAAGYGERLGGLTKCSSCRRK